MAGKTWRNGFAVLIAKASHFLIISAYLWMLLTVFALHNSLVMTDWSLFEHLGAAVLKALVFAKFILVGEHLKVGRRVEHLPLIFPILIKAAMFAVILIAFNYVEEVLVAYFRPDAPAEAAGMDVTDMRTALSLALMVFIALIPFFGVMELSRVIGQEKMRELFFRRRVEA